MSREEIARRFAEADRRIVLLRRATFEMQAVREFVFRDRVPCEIHFDILRNWREIGRRAGR